MLERIRGTGKAVETPIGWVPTPDAIDTAGLEVAPGALEKALAVDRGEWVTALDELGQFYQQFGDRMPRGIRDQHAATLAKLRR
jgi:phosphoenolpyruvate carboxykinase (GTP)